MQFTTKFTAKLCIVRVYCKPLMHFTMERHHLLIPIYHFVRKLERLHLLIPIYHFVRKLFFFFIFLLPNAS
jgi:hypothetical protein